MFKTKEEYLLESAEEIQSVYKQQIGRLVDRIAKLEKDYVKIKDCAIESQKECEELREKLADYLKEKDNEHKFKAGDKIRFVGTLNDYYMTENESYFSEDMRYLEDREPREILSIYYECVEIPNTFEAELEGIIGIWVYYEDDFEKVEE